MQDAGRANLLKAKPRCGSGWRITRITDRAEGYQHQGDHCCKPCEWRSWHWLRLSTIQIFGRIQGKCYSWLMNWKIGRRNWESMSTDIFLQQGGGGRLVMVGMAFWTSSLINIVYPHAIEILLYPPLHQQVTTARDHICQPEGADWDFRFMAPTFLHSSLDGLAGQWRGVIGCAASRICDRGGNLLWWYFTCLHLWQICC